MRLGIVPRSTTLPLRTSVFAAQRAGDINGFLGDPLHGLTFRNVTFENLPEKEWSCGYVDLDTFTQVDVVPPLKCSRDGA